MTEIRLYFQGERAGPLFQRSVFRQAARVRAAARDAADETAADILTLGRADISSAGNFGTRWTQGLHDEVTEGGGSIRISVGHDVPYFSVFEEGKTILGKPMLWIPLGFADDAKGVFARDYPGGLFRVDRKQGAPLLLSIADRQPKYFGRDHVVIPKKFHIVEIVKEAARRFKDLYRSFFSSERE